MNYWENWWNNMDNKHEIFNNLLLYIWDLENEIKDEWNKELLHKDNGTEARMDILEAKAVVLDKIKCFIITEMRK